MSERAYRDYIILQNNILKERHGVKAVHTADELYLLHSRFKDNIRLITCKLKGEMIAGTVLYEYKDVIHTQYLAANDETRKLGHWI